MACGRHGVIKIMDPATLKTVSRIHFDVPSDGAGLEGVSASSDGATIYVEGPTAGLSGASGSCCFLYSVDTATLHAKTVAGVWGSDSRRSFVNSNGVVYRAADLFARGANADIAGDQMYLDPSGRLLFRISRLRGPALDVYDVSQGSLIRRLALAGLDGPWQLSGVWSGGRFYLYAANHEGSPSRLWAVSTSTVQLGPGVEVETFGQSPGCPPDRLEKITAAGGNLFVYEAFGTKIDRRSACHKQIPGGAWLVDPETGRLLQHVAPDRHFSALIPDRAEPVLYGLANSGPSWQAPVELVRIDARDGRVMLSRILSADVWRIAIAPLRSVPAGEPRVSAKEILLP